MPVEWTHGRSAALFMLVILVHAGAGMEPLGELLASIVWAAILMAVGLALVKAVYVGRRQFGTPEG